MRKKALLLCALAFVMVVEPVQWAKSQTRSEVEHFPLMDFSSVSVGPYNGTSPNSSVLDVFDDLSPPEEWTYIPVNVWIVADEEFRSKNYETTWFQTVGWEDYVQNVVERGDNRLYQVFGIDLCIVGVGTWQSDNSKIGDEVLYDAINKTGFMTGKTRINNKVVDVLIAFTGQYLGFCAGALKVKKAIIMQYNVYWADDNVLSHEVSHLFGAQDHYEGDQHYYDDCVMSSRFVHVDFWVEDNWIWYIGNDICVAAISSSWCMQCQRTINSQKLYFNVKGYPSNKFYLWR